MKRAGPLLLAIGLVPAACTPGSTPTTTTTVVDVSTTGSVSADPRLVVVDAAGDVVVMEGDGSNALPIAQSADGGPAFGQPIWSPDGALISYARAEELGFSYVLHDLETGTESETAVDQFPFYAHWSPTADHVGVLRNGEAGVTFEMIDATSGALTPMGSATPYYFAWSPDGADVVGHAGPVQLIRQSPTGVVDEEGETSANYLAPNWIDRGIVHVQGDDLVITSSEGETSPVATIEDFTFFVVNTQGTRIATQMVSANPAITVALEQVPAPAANTVSIVDLEDGTVSVALDGPAAGFFWSPDGERLLILGVDEGRGMLTAKVWEAGVTREYTSFVPHPSQVRDVYPFFPQYALSMSYWSADSMAFAIVGGIGDEAGVWVQDVEASSPVLVSEGSWVAWAP